MILDTLSADSSVNQTRSLALPFFDRPLSSCLLPQTSLRGNPFIWEKKGFARGRTRFETEAKVLRPILESDNGNKIN